QSRQLSGQRRFYGAGSKHTLPAKVGDGALNVYPGGVLGQDRANNYLERGLRGHQCIGPSAAVSVSKNCGNSSWGLPAPGGTWAGTPRPATRGADGTVVVMQGNPGNISLG